MHLSVESDPRELLSYETSIQRELRPGPSCSKGCYLSCNVLKYKIKRIGPHVRLRDIIVSSYPIIPCNFA